MHFSVQLNQFGEMVHFIILYYWTYYYNTFSLIPLMPATSEEVN